MRVSSQRLAEDHYVERVVGRNARVVARLGPDVARAVEARARLALGAAAAGTGRRLPALVRGIAGVTARRDDRLTRDRAAEPEDVLTGARMSHERDSAGLCCDPPVTTNERPLDRRTAACRSGRPLGPGRSRSSSGAGSPTR